MEKIHQNLNDSDNTDKNDDRFHRNLSEPNETMAARSQQQQRSMTAKTTSIPSQLAASSMSTFQTETEIPTIRSNQSFNSKMSMFFFRLHNLQREQENKRKKSVQQRQRQRRGAKVFRSDSDTTGHLTLAPSRLFERPPVKPSDSLDEIALQIPRYL